MASWRSAAIDRRFVMVAVIASVAAFLVLGLPAAVVPNPLFVRMTPTEPINVATLLLSAPLIGLIAATYLSRPPVPGCDDVVESGMKRASVGTVAAYLAIGCPICNKVLVAVLGVSGALNTFAPLQPLIGASSVLMLAGTLAWRLRLRRRGCESCRSTRFSTPLEAAPSARP